ncbi:MAG: protein kinase [bacterium]|nr:protein kinase [bacterium]
MDHKPPSDSQRPLIDVLSALSRGPTRYDEKEELARGGMGSIHRVWDRELRREAAMKVFLGPGEVPQDASRDSAVDPRLARFVEEAQVTGQLDHPGIPPVHELGLDAEGNLFFTMQLVRGKTLGEVLELSRAGDPHWTQGRILRALVRVCEAVAYAHARGVVHRDLKPANIMVGPFGEVYVMDWGLAKIQGADERPLPAASERVQSDRAAHTSSSSASYLSTLDGSVLGTPAYMPPEQARGRQQDVGPHSDVYAIGAILYECLTSRAPYASHAEERTAVDVLRAVLDGPPAAIDTIVPDVPDELTAIAEKAMAREASERYAGPMEIAADLDQFFERPVTRARNVLRQSRLITGLLWVFGFMFWTMVIGFVLASGVLLLSQGSSQTNLAIDLPVRFQATEPGFAFTGQEEWIHEVRVGELGGNLQVTSSRKLFLVIMSTLGLGALAFFLYIVHQTRHILRSLRRGDPFSNSNTARMRRIGGAMLLLGILKTVQNPITAVFAQRILRAEGVAWSNAAEIAYTELLIAALILVLAEVFRVGAELENRSSTASEPAVS